MRYVRIVWFVLVMCLARIGVRGTEEEGSSREYTHDNRVSRFDSRNSHASVQSKLQGSRSGRSYKIDSMNGVTGFMNRRKKFRNSKRNFYFGHPGSPGRANRRMKQNRVQLENPDDSGGISDLLSFKAHLHHSVDDVGKAFRRRPVMEQNYFDYDYLENSPFDERPLIYENNDMDYPEDLGDYLDQSLQGASNNNDEFEGQPGYSLSTVIEPLSMQLQKLLMTIRFVNENLARFQKKTDRDFEFSRMKRGNDVQVTDRLREVIDNGTTVKITTSGLLNKIRFSDIETTSKMDYFSSISESDFNFVPVEAHEFNRINRPKFVRIGRNLKSIEQQNESENSDDDRYFLPFEDLKKLDVRNVVGIEPADSGVIIHRERAVNERSKRTADVVDDLRNEMKALQENLKFLNASNSGQTILRSRENNEETTTTMEVPRYFNIFEGYADNEETTIEEVKTTVEEEKLSTRMLTLPTTTSRENLIDDRLTDFFTSTLVPSSAEETVITIVTETNSQGTTANEINTKCGTQETNQEQATTAISLETSSTTTETSEASSTVETVSVTKENITTTVSTVETTASTTAESSTTENIVSIDTESTTLTSTIISTLSTSETTAPTTSESTTLNTSEVSTLSTSETTAPTSTEVTALDTEDTISTTTISKITEAPLSETTESMILTPKITESTTDVITETSLPTLSTSEFTTLGSSTEKINQMETSEATGTPTELSTKILETTPILSEWTEPEETSLVLQIKITIPVQTSTLSSMEVTEEKTASNEISTEEILTVDTNTPATSTELSISGTEILDETELDKFLTTPEAGEENDFPGSVELDYEDETEGPDKWYDYEEEMITLDEISTTAQFEESSSPVTFESTLEISTEKSTIETTTESVIEEYTTIRKSTSEAVVSETTGEVESTSNENTTEKDEKKFTLGITETSQSTDNEIVSTEATSKLNSELIVEVTTEISSEFSTTESMEDIKSTVSEPTTEDGNSEFTLENESTTFFSTTIEFSSPQEKKQYLKNRLKELENREEELLKKEKELEHLIEQWELEKERLKNKVQHIGQEIGGNFTTPVDEFETTEMIDRTTASTTISEELIREIDELENRVTIKEHDLNERNERLKKMEKKLRKEKDELEKELERQEKKIKDEKLKEENEFTSTEFTSSTSNISSKLSTISSVQYETTEQPLSTFRVTTEVPPIESTRNYDGITTEDVTRRIIQVHREKECEKDKNDEDYVYDDEEEVWRRKKPEEIESVTTKICLNVLKDDSSKNLLTKRVCLPVLPELDNEGESSRRVARKLFAIDRNSRKKNEETRKIFNLNLRDHEWRNDETAKTENFKGFTRIYERTSLIPKIHWSDKHKIQNQKHGKYFRKPKFHFDDSTENEFKGIRKKMYTVNVLSLNYDEDEENYKTVNSTIKSEYSISDDYNDLSNESYNINSNWPTEKNLNYHLGGTNSWDVEVTGAPQSGTTCVHVVIDGKSNEYQNDHKCEEKRDIKSSADFEPEEDSEDENSYDYQDDYSALQESGFKLKNFRTPLTEIKDSSKNRVYANDPNYYDFVTEFAEKEPIVLPNIDINQEKLAGNHTKANITKSEQTTMKYEIQNYSNQTNCSTSSDNCVIENKKFIQPILKNLSQTTEAYDYTNINTVIPSSLSDFIREYDVTTETPNVNYVKNKLSHTLLGPMEVMDATNNYPATTEFPFDNPIIMKQFPKNIYVVYKCASPEIIAEYDSEEETESFITQTRPLSSSTTVEKMFTTMKKQEEHVTNSQTEQSSTTLVINSANTSTTSVPLQTDTDDSLFWTSTNDATKSCRLLSHEHEGERIARAEKDSHWKFSRKRNSKSRKRTKKKKKKSKESRAKMAPLNFEKDRPYDDYSIEAQQNVRNRRMVQSEDYYFNELPAEVEGTDNIHRSLLTLKKKSSKPKVKNLIYHDVVRRKKKSEIKSPDDAFLDKVMEMIDSEYSDSSIFNSAGSSNDVNKLKNPKTRSLLQKVKNVINKVFGKFKKNNTTEQSHSESRIKKKTKPDHKNRKLILEDSKKLLPPNSVHQDRKLNHSGTARKVIPTHRSRKSKSEALLPLIESINKKNRQRNLKNNKFHETDVNSVIPAVRRMTTKEKLGNVKKIVVYVDKTNAISNTNTLGRKNDRENSKKKLVRNVDKKLKNGKRKMDLRKKPFKKRNNWIDKIEKQSKESTKVKRMIKFKEEQKNAEADNINEIQNVDNNYAFEDNDIDSPRNIKSRAIRTDLEFDKAIQKLANNELEPLEENDRRSLKALISELMDVQKNVNTTLHIIQDKLEPKLSEDVMNQQTTINDSKIVGSKAWATEQLKYVLKEMSKDAEVRADVIGKGDKNRSRIDDERPIDNFSGKRDIFHKSKSKKNETKVLTEIEKKKIGQSRKSKTKKKNKLNNKNKERKKNSENIKPKSEKVNEISSSKVDKDIKKILREEDSFVKDSDLKVDDEKNSENEDRNEEFVSNLVDDINFSENRNDKLDNDIHDLLDLLHYKEELQKNRVTGRKIMQYIEPESPFDDISNLSPDRFGNRRLCTATKKQNSKSKKIAKEMKKQLKKESRINRSSKIQRVRSSKENCSSCVCDLEETLKNLKSMLERMNDPLDEIEMLKCNSYEDVGMELAITVNEESSEYPEEEVKRFRRSPLKPKGQQYIKPEELDEALQRGLESQNDYEVVSLPGYDINIPCDKDRDIVNWITGISQPSYTWKRTDGLSISGFVRKNGDLELYDVDAKDSGNYTCMISYVDPDNDEPVENVYETSIQIVTLPIYTLRGESHYRIQSCEEIDLDVLITHFPRTLKNILCRREICSIHVLSPYCYKEKVSINTLITPSQTNKLIPVGPRRCGLLCKKAIQDKMTYLLSKNLRSLLGKPIIFSFSHRKEKLVPIKNRLLRRKRGKSDGNNSTYANIGLLLGCPAGYGLRNTHCVPCTSGSYSEDGVSTCKNCPVGTHQPKNGARACRPCTNPFLKGCYNMLWSSSTALLIILASLIAIFVVFSLIIWLVCSTRRKSKKELCLELDQPYRNQEVIEMQSLLQDEDEGDDGTYEYQLISKKKRRKINSNKKLGGNRSKISARLLGVESYRSKQNYPVTPKKFYHKKPPLPDPDFDG